MDSVCRGTPYPGGGVGGGQAILFVTPVVTNEVISHCFFCSDDEVHGELLPIEVCSSLLAAFRIVGAFTFHCQYS